MDIKRKILDNKMNETLDGFNDIVRKATQQDSYQKDFSEAPIYLWYKQHVKELAAKRFAAVKKQKSGG